MLYIGIDLGTSAVKLLLVNADGTIVNEVSKEYPVCFPNPGWSEQNPSDWVDNVFAGIDELITDVDKSQIAGIGCGGQMHGLVVLDEYDNVIRPAILWNDGRTSAEVEYLNNVIGKDVLSDNTANIAFAGFTAPKILWMKNNEPENFAKIRKIMLPKDYINYVLTGAFATDFSDASGMLLLDVRNKKWSEKMIGICSITAAQLPSLYESYDVIGTIKPEIAEKFGLSADVKVVAGAGDNAAAAIGTGTIGNGNCNISVGTSGTVFISNNEFGVDSNNALHSFAHADGGYHLMGCILSAASCNKWFMKDILNDSDYDSIQQKITDEMLGENSVYFLPYLMGERSPINDTNARGSFIGMSLDTKTENMLQAVLEGVAFAIRDSFEVAKSLNINITSSNICGGGSKSKLWQKIFANILNIDLNILQTEQGPGFGAAILAMVACDEYITVADACDKLVNVSYTVHPDKEIADRYEKKYKIFRSIYPALKNIFADMNTEE